MQFRQDLWSDRHHPYRSSARGGADAIAQHTGIEDEAALPIGAGVPAITKIRGYVSANHDA